MLSEFALSPAIFQTASYESSAVADMCLRALGPPLLEDCIVRNLHEGGWFRHLQNHRDSLHPKAKELIKKLEKQKRLVIQDAISVACPGSDEEWENEAIASHEKSRLTGMIFSRESKANRHRNDPVVECPEKLSSADFWKERPCSRRIARTIDEYSLLLGPLLQHTKFIAFMDPHLDPDQPRYADFIKLLSHPNLTTRTYKPRIQCHRVASLGSGKEKVAAIAEIEKRFRDQWTAELERNRVKVEVFLWNDFHDRFVASDLLSMTWSNGFDTTTDPSARVTVSRLSRDDRDGLQMEFAENSTCHHLQRKFTIG